MLNLQVNMKVFLLVLYFITSEKVFLLRRMISFVPSSRSISHLALKLLSSATRI
jgi:hypothetical protein